MRKVELRERQIVADEVNGLVSIAVVLLRNRRRLLVQPAAWAFLIALVLYLLPRTYTTSTSFLPRAESGLSSMAGLAAQIGIAVPVGGATSPRVFAQIARSNQLIRAAVVREYAVRERRLFRDPVERTGTLVDFFEVDEDDPEAAVQKAMELLREQLAVSADDLAGTVALSFKSKWPDLSYQVVDGLLADVQRYNQESRQSQAGAERVFVQARLGAAIDSLQAAEDSLARFLERNREFRSAPILLFQHERLQRAVMLRQQVAVSLAQAYEQAQLAEVRDTPVITVVSAPLLAAKPDRRHMLVKAIGLYILVFASFVSLAFLRAAIDSGLHADDARQELARLVEEAKSDSRRLLQRVGIAFNSTGHSG